MTEELGDVTLSPRLEAVKNSVGTEGYCLTVNTVFYFLLLTFQRLRFHGP